MMSNKKRAVKIPYEGYTLPKCAEQGGKFIDFNKILKPIKPDVAKKRLLIFQDIADKIKLKYKKTLINKRIKVSFLPIFSFFRLSKFKDWPKYFDFCHYF